MEGATALSLSRFFPVEPLVYAAPLSLFSLLVCLLVFLGVSRGSGFVPLFLGSMLGVRGARIGLTTDIGLLGPWT